MRATEEGNKPVDGRDVARRLRESGAGVQPVPGGSTPDRPVMTGARGLLPALPRGGSGGAACGPSRPSTRGHGVGGADDLGPRQAPLGGTTTQDHRLARRASSRPVVPPGCGPARSTPRPAAPWAGGGRGGLDSIESSARTPGIDKRARSATTLGGPPSARVPGQGDDLEGHRRGAPVPSWSGGAGLRVAFHPAGPPRARSAPMVRADHRVPGTPEPASPWARGMDGARARGLGDLDPRGRGGGLLEGRRVCAGPADRGAAGTC